jgi:hypothetical protein
MAMNSWFSITESNAFSSTKTALDLLDDFFMPIQKQSTKNKHRCSDDGDNGSSSALGARVSQKIKARRQKQGKKEEKEERPLK